MESIINKTFKSLKINYVIHLIVLIIILIFNFVLVSQILWLKKIFGNLYLLMNYISIINFIFPMISFIFIIKNKITKKNINKFKIITIIFCTLAIIFGFFFSGVLMINAIESPEFCKECPFNLPLSEINSFPNYNLNKKCNERRCVKNSPNPETNIKNENDLYEYICNYNPTDEFDEIKESKDIENNNTISKNSDNIFCKELTKDEILNTELENNYSNDFYDMCNIYTKLYICERNQLPNKFKIEKNFVCPEKDYMTKLVIFCMLNVLINLIFGFFPWKSELNKYTILIMNYEPRRTNQKSNSFSSTINDSKGIKENISENNFEKTPTEIIIVCGNKNNNITNSINDINNNINNINNIIKKKSTKKINFMKNFESSEEQSDKNKNKTEIKFTKKITINNINIINNNNTETIYSVNETERNLNDNNIEQNNKNEEIRVTIYDKNNNVTTAKKINLANNKK